MTIAVSVKVHDGVVLAADSAATLFGTDPSGARGVVKVYNTANKVFNLYKGLPIGVITWGSGSIGCASISTLAKDLRRRLMGRDAVHREWAIEPGDYTIEQTAKAVRRFFYDELYLPSFKEFPEKPLLGFIVAGYSAGQGLAEEWRVQIENGECADPQLVRDREATGINWNGEPRGHYTNPDRTWNKAS